MNAPALLAELESAGIHITREGDNLRVRADPGISLAPYVERITVNKPALLREVLQRRIIAALDVAPQDFDRPAYERLCALWRTENMKESSTP